MGSHPFKPEKYGLVFCFQCHGSGKNKDEKEPCRRCGGCGLLIRNENPCSTILWRDSVPLCWEERHHE